MRGFKAGTILAAAGLALASAAEPAAAQDCSRLEGRHPGSVTVVRASEVQAAGGWTPVPAAEQRWPSVQVSLCRVEGVIEENIGFELWLPLPARWNGRLLAAGVGGPAGFFNYGDMSRRANEGFATVSTDSGHKASNDRWMADPQARVDYEHRATHLTTVAARELVRRFYGREATRRYFLGCSGGGRQGLKEMQNYPDDYHGIVSGAPGPNMPLNSIRMMWFSLLQKWQPQAALNDSDWALYESAATRACDMTDGLSDGIIGNPLACSFDTTTLLCPEEETRGCLTPQKLAMLQAIIAPMPDEKGRPMDDGLFPGVRTRPGPPSPLLRAMWADAVYDDPEWDEDRFQRTRDLEAVYRTMPELRADRTDIAPFIAAGGKAIIYQGWQDPSVVAGPTIDYYQALAAANGGVEALAEAVRLFLAPGMLHCRGGPGADQFGGSGQETASGDPSRDILWALIAWVEQGRPPDTIVARKIEDGRTRFARPLCRFPQSARYDGSGDPSEAGSFRCAPDPQLTRYGAAER
ncbi:tannase/feruloyl esterase family alpha/beta hydrolase [Sphingosinicella sp. CPCC 101087]|uniref:tannase/feruloyl esterase family alpha/beta hydrolase n=1 Tax=Sphingosinicella sp. CPCC 101087 TaxID=2497754 RepID=UPI00101D030A|nr:tannase/feruloyl esterase family alpha/beta hydrolase [Sphingosinicella sp. CPCC 101087]